jgi:hypothetical protein
MIRDELLYDAKRQEEPSPLASKYTKKQDRAVTETLLMPGQKPEASRGSGSAK